MKIRFVSGNQEKIKEVQSILGQSGIEVIPISLKIEELQTEDVEKLVKDKLLKAFKKIGKPVFVEHTGLNINYLNGFPAGLGQIFWDKLGADKFAEIIGNLRDTRVTAETMIGYCDGIKINFFKGSIEGNILNTPAGDRTFQWDCVFIPHGYEKTFADLGAEKNSISMRKKALDAFKEYLEREK